MKVNECEGFEDALAQCISRGLSAREMFQYLKRTFPAAQMPASVQNVSLWINSRKLWRDFIQSKGWNEAERLWALHQGRIRQVRGNTYTSRTLEEKTRLKRPQEAAAA